MAVNLSDPTELNGASATGTQGTKLGKVENVYLDNETGRAEWAALKTGMFGGHVSLVPLAAADFQNGNLHLPYSKDQVQNAPHHDPGQELSVDDEKELFTHYGVAYEGDTATAQSGQDQQARREQQQGQHDQGQQHQGQHDQGQRHEGQQGLHAQGEHQGGDDRRDRHGEAGVVGQDTSGPTTDEAMTRSEEELRVGTQTVQTGRARLRKHVVTEQQTITVPVSHEEVTLEREEITDTNRDAATSGANISEEEHEVTLHAEQPVVTTETVAKERVRMGTKTVQEQERVSGEVRKEEIDMEPGTDGGQDRAETGDGTHQK